MLGLTGSRLGARMAMHQEAARMCDSTDRSAEGPSSTDAIDVEELAVSFAEDGCLDALKGLWKCRPHCPEITSFPEQVRQSQASSLFMPAEKMFECKPFWGLTMSADSHFGT